VGIAAAGIAASAASLGSSIAGAASGGAPATNSYGGQPNYIPTGLPQADQYYQGITGSLYPYATSVPGQVVPGLEQYAANLQNNPYAGGAQWGANEAAQVGSTMGPQLINLGNQESNAGQAILGTAFDPQQNLYNLSQNQAAQTAAAANAQAGVQGPYAAGTTDQALQNFNTNWQNQQLARQTQGLQSYAASRRAKKSPARGGATGCRVGRTPLENGANNAFGLILTTAVRLAAFRQKKAPPARAGLSHDAHNIRSVPE
jgi:hypothetical protein